MKPCVAMFYHSLVSDWNHGNAHFLRGIASELQARGHQVRIFEPQEGWSCDNLTRDHGSEAIQKFKTAFPDLKSQRYSLENFDLDRALDDADLILVHEWNDPHLIAAIGEYRHRNPAVRVLFHDTHHRAVTAQHELARFHLDRYDGVLAYGASLKSAYQQLGWGKQVYVWHEAADVRTFYPRSAEARSGDIVWIGNWGDGERSEELHEFLIRPIQRHGWKAQVHGVRYPETALTELASANITYKGWLPNFEVPQTFAQFKATIHVPRRPYTRQLPGIPTIRPFEALACGIPLVSAPWDDTEGLFRVGQDFLMAADGNEMEGRLSDVLHDASMAADLSKSGLETIHNRHTCGHRVTELLNIYQDIRPAPQTSYSHPYYEVQV